MNLGKTLIILASLVLFGAGCSQGIDFDIPPEIRYGEDVCDACSMIISEPRFAAAYYTDPGDVRRFDDIGDMCRYHIQNREPVARFWVHDYDTEAWLLAKDAAFVMSDGLYTPMASGVVAFSNLERARTFADESKGLLMSFDELMDVYARAESGNMHTEMNN